jgi:voltage-gated potassium channel
MEENDMATRIREAVRLLYNGDSRRAHQFRYGLLAFDILTITFLIISSFVHTPHTEILDGIIGILLSVDFAARLWIAARPWHYLRSVYGIADLLVILSLLAPVVGEGLAFLRIARVMRLFRSYQLLKRLRADFRWFERNEQTIIAGLNLFVFVFVATAVVYETQHLTNPDIRHYGDALYFTIATLTTTGFGDVTLVGAWGRTLSILIMIFGVSMFLRLIQVLMRPHKVEHKCPVCGLKRHDHDAVHCKACGTVLNIEDEGGV